MISHVALQAIRRDRVMVTNACTPLDRACPVIVIMRDSRMRDSRMRDSEKGKKGRKRFGDESFVRESVISPPSPSPPFSPYAMGARGTDMTHRQ